MTVAKYDWELKQLQWLHPELKVQPPEANPRPFKIHRSKPRYESWESA